MSVTAAVCYLARRNYRGLASPYHPPERYNELAFLPPDALSRENSVYAGVRRVLAGMGLDAERFGRPEWNPMGAFVRPGQTVVIKPNLVRHFNGKPLEDLDSVVTHGSVLRPLIDYAWKALDLRGRVIVADAPQHDCSVEAVKRYLGWETLRDFYGDALGVEVEFLDLRRQFVRCLDGIVVSREDLPGDPSGYSAVDLGEGSAFDGSGEGRGLRGSDYDVEETVAHHSEGRHAYLISKTVLGADLVINAPKMKTHGKAGVTLALKNVVGINGDKNWLPHFRAGFPEDGGDEYPLKTPPMVFRHWMVERCRPWLNRSRLLTAFRWARRIESRALGTDFLRAGNWYGNDTVWRMVLDLNRIFYFADREGHVGLDRNQHRRALTVCDGIVAGEGEGPMSATRKPLGVLSGAVDPVGLDLALLEIMGFDWRRIPKVVRAMDRSSGPFTDVTAPGDVEVIEIDLRERERVGQCGLAGMSLRAPFQPSTGWVGHIENQAREDEPRESVAAGGVAS